MPAVPVKLETLQSDTVKDSSKFVGNLEAVQIVEVRPEIQGRIEQILVEPGQEVGAGQSVMVLKPDQTVPNYEGSLAGVDVAIGSRENAVKGLDIAKAQLETARAQLELDTVNVARAQQLVEAGALGQIRLDEALTQQEASQNAVITAEEQVSAAHVQIQHADAAAEVDVAVAFHIPKLSILSILGIDRRGRGHTARHGCITAGDQLGVGHFSCCHRV